MTRRFLWSATAGTAGFVVVVLAALLLVPQLLYPHLTEAELHAVSTADARIQLQQAQSQLQNTVRGTLLQAVAGLLVIAGALATWRQVQVNREGQITERFTRAVDQLGGENIDVRIGGIYALERVARNSAADRPQVQYILAAFIRGHAPWPGEGGDPEPRPLPWLYVRAPDVQACLNVLVRRLPSPGALRLYLSRVDLRSANLDNAKLVDAQIRHATLARSWLVAASLAGSDLCYTDFGEARAHRTDFTGAALRGASFRDADVAGADFRGADLRGADLRAANLDQADLTGVRTDAETVWPEGFPRP
ncbi:MAG TPA: pentapeptide repeat-containing protein [Amycolatopsis sp.]|uniref:Pentapeptide repeat-containing protein n=1 Tax=Amycolatopsis nalaikhensis TaxID=715472 RepID=A0ABY8XKA0_9PSEU|nr:pentapeptide repeat-containing protein [Amycolatopsis sp. 2-2]WIV55991.1 pentapeptide repeat-containing protein [Amycolatopsis sp. 2-2]